jgi:hypothetical protein
MTEPSVREADGSQESVNDHGAAESRTSLATTIGIEGRCRARDLGRRRPVTIKTFENHGLRFEYPSRWELEENEEGPVRAVTVQDPGGLGFAVISIDERRPDPADVADEALAAMRTEYPDLDAAPAMETINDHCATGHDVEFFSLDLTNAASIRCFRTPSRTVLAFGQWSDVGEADLPELIRGVFRSIEEVEPWNTGLDHEVMT